MKERHINLFNTLSEDNQVALISAAVTAAARHPRGCTDLALESLLDLMLKARGIKVPI